MNRNCRSFLSWITFSLVLFSVHSHLQQCAPRKAVTFNTALLDMPLIKQVPNNRIERRHAISDALRDLDADVICLQEVWIGEDLEFLTESLADIYPFSFSKMHVGGVVPPQIAPKLPPCNPLAVMNLYGCMKVNRCLRKSSGRNQIYLCAVTRCFVPFLKLSQKCVSCAVKSFTGPIETYKKCVSQGVPMIGMRDINEPGIAILSKSPLLNAKYVDFHRHTKEAIERGYLEADSPELGKIACTHMTFTGPTYYEPELSVKGIFSSYLEQGISERQQIIERFSGVSPLLLMGDFNIGDVFSPAVTPVLPQAFQYMARVFDVIPVKECTLCGPRNNPYGIRQELVIDGVVDHIFFKGHRVKGVVRIMTPMDAVLLSGLALSDHYGVMALIETC